MNDYESQILNVYFFLNPWLKETTPEENFIFNDDLSYLIVKNDKGGNHYDGPTVQLLFEYASSQIDQSLPE